MAKNENFDKLFQWETVVAISSSIGDLLFSLAHWILAFVYFKVAKNTPRIHAGKEVKPYTVLKWTGIAINTFFPLCELVAWIASNYTVFVSQSDKLWVVYA